MNARAFDTEKWAIDNFAGCNLGDVRRTKRLVTMAAQVASRPAASLPTIGQSWCAVKSIYRLLDRPEATLHSVTETHRKNTTSQQGCFLILSDTTYITFAKTRQIKDAGPVGPGESKGFLLHSGLMFDVKTQGLVGMAGQVSHVRKQKWGKQDDTERMKRWRESEMWLELFEQVSTPSEGSQFIHVCDAAAGNFESYCTLNQLDCDFVIRSGRQRRRVLSPDGRSLQLSEYLKELTELGEYDLQIARGNGRKARSARLRVSSGPVTLLPPKHRSKRIKEWNRPIDLWVVVVEEVSAPRNVDPIRWVLTTSLPAKTFSAAWEIIGCYEKRWLVEEWHSV